ncbi:hypothetical protein B0H11DRAFT_2245900 [Mycena galericulata]|nr:hypothetical protein B0H11DRAFT_2245900 [Mycena galericulata]
MPSESITKTHTIEVPQMTLEQVFHTRDVIKQMYPETPKMPFALLFGDGWDLRAPVFVRVPLKANVKVAQSVHDLDVDIWLDAGRAASGASLDLERLCHQVDRFPFDSTTNLTHSYSVVVASQRGRGGNVYPHNRMVSNLVGAPWRGNVLVFRHGTTVHKRIINITEKELAMAILTRVIQDGLVGSDDYSGHYAQGVVV